MKTKAKSDPVMDALDRFYLLYFYYKPSFITNNKTVMDWSRFCKGKMTHIAAFRNGKLHIRYVPKECVQFFFDAYNKNTL